MSHQSTRRLFRIGLFGLAAVALGTIFVPRSVAFSDGQSEPSTASKQNKVELAKLAVLKRAQQIVVAQAELALLGTQQQAAEQKVKLASANLEVEVVNTENVNSLFEKQVISSKEKQLQAAKRDAAEAALSVAKAESEGAAIALTLKKANIELLEIRKKEAAAILSQTERD